jgi:hypothetical protein
MSVTDHYLVLFLDKTSTMISQAYKEEQINYFNYFIIDKDTNTHIIWRMKDGMIVQHSMP